MDSTKNEDKLIDKAAREFARKELLPDREERDRYLFEPFSQKILDTAFEVDFFHLNLTEDFGGIGRKITPLCIVLKNLSETDAGMAAIIFTNSFSHELFFESGDTSVLKKIVSDKNGIERFLIAYPIFTHPDETRSRVTAELKDGKYILSGITEQLVLGGVAKQCLIPGNISGQPQSSLFFVDLDSPGVQLSDPLLNLGVHTCPSTDLALERVEAILVGKEGQGGVYFSKAANRLQICGAAISSGIMTGSFEEALAYSRTRIQGGRKIVEWSELQMILTDMAIKTNTSKELLARACQAADAMSSGWEKDVSAATIYIQDAACQVTTDGVQVLGGSGYMKDYGQEKRFRDANHLQTLLGMGPLKKIRYLKTLL